MQILWTIIDIIRIVVGLFFLLCGAIYVAIGHVIVTDATRKKLSDLLYTPLAEATAGQRRWSEVVPVNARAS